MTLAIYDAGKVFSATSDKGSDAVSTANAQAGESLTSVNTTSGLCEIDPSSGVNFYTTASGNVLVGIINHTHVASRVKQFSLEVTSSASGTLQVSGGYVFGDSSAVNVPVEIGINHYVIAESSNGTWLYGRVSG